MILDNSSNIWIYWSALRNDNWDIYARSYDGSVWSSEYRVTSNAAVDYNQEICLDNEGNILMVWESDRDGNREIYLTTFNGSSWGTQQRLTANTYPDQRPNVIVDNSSNIWVAYDSFRSQQRDFNVFMVYHNGTSWSSEYQVTGDPGTDYYPHLAVDGEGKLWIAHVGHAGDSTTQYKVKIFDGVNWYAPVMPAGETYINDDTGSIDRPQIFSDALGRIWCFWTDQVQAKVAYRFYYSNTWTNISILPGSGGMGYNPFQNITFNTNGDVWVIREENYGGGENMQIMQVSNPDPAATYQTPVIFSINIETPNPPADTGLILPVFITVIISGPILLQPLTMIRLLHTGNQNQNSGLLN